MHDEFPFAKTGITYLDSAASTQKPKVVLETIKQFYEESYANVHRGIHQLAEKATKAYEGARKTVAQFINAPTEKHVIFTKGTTEAMNLLASTYPLTKNDIIITTELDHHSTFVPWQQAAKRNGATFKVIPQVNGQLDMKQAEKIIGEGCTVLATLHLSNVTGSVQDIKKLAELVHKQKGHIVVDGAQAAPHLNIDVQDLNIDAYAFSAHKCYGPTGIGAVYIKKQLIDKLPPYQFGGEMIHEVTKEKTTWASVPAKFEAGTPPIAQAAAFAAAINWLQEKQQFWKYEEELVHYAYELLSKEPGVSVIGPVNRKALVAFTVDNIHAHDVAQFLDQQNIAIRAGHHCTQVLHDALNITASCRASIGLYNKKADIDKLVEVIRACKEAFNV